MILKIKKGPSTSFHRRKRMNIS